MVQTLKIGTQLAANEPSRRLSEVSLFLRFCDFDFMCDCRSRPSQGLETVKFIRGLVIKTMDSLVTIGFSITASESYRVFNNSCRKITAYCSSKYVSGRLPQMWYIC